MFINTSKMLSFHNILLAQHLVYETFYRRRRFINFTNSPFYRWRSWSTKHWEHKKRQDSKEGKEMISLGSFLHVIPPTVNTLTTWAQNTKGGTPDESGTKRIVVLHTAKTSFKPLQTGVNPSSALSRGRNWYNPSICIPVSSSSAFCFALFLSSQTGSHVAQTDLEPLLSPPPSESWGSRSCLSHPAIFSVFVAGKVHAIVGNVRRNMTCTMEVSLGSPALE